MPRSLTFWLAMAVMAVPTVAGLGAASGSLVAPTSGSQVTLSLGHGPSAPARYTAGAPGMLPGTVSSIGSTVAGQLTSQWLVSQHRWAEHNASLARPSSGAAAPAARPLTVTIPTGTFTGRVLNSSSLQPLQGATVEAYSVGGAICPATTCAPVSTNSTGYYSATCPVGADYITAALPWYLQNVTYGTCRLATIVNLGTTYLVAEGKLEGTVRSAAPGHPAIAGVYVTTLSRDGTTPGNPSTTTDAYGNFLVAVPPLPSKVSFGPGPDFLGNFTWANATPGHVYQIGTIYLLRLVEIRVQAYSRATGNALPGPTAVQACSALTNVCLPDGPTSFSGCTVALAVPGPTFIHVKVNNYLENITNIGYVPELAPGTAYPSSGCLKVFTLPLSSATLYVAISHLAGTTYPWASGLYSVSIAGLNGYSDGVYNPITTNVSETVTITGCLGAIAKPVVVPVFPLHNSITVAPDTTGVCTGGPPGGWPIPGDMPVWGNTTWVTAPPESQANGTAYDNLTPGTYVYGHVYVEGPKGPTAPTHAFQVAAYSTDYPTLTQDPYAVGISGWTCSQSQTADGFCVPVPPGHYLLKAASAGYYPNWTWGWSENFCCNKTQTTSSNTITLGKLSDRHVQSINLTPEGAVHGNAYIAGTKLGPTFGSVAACSTVSSGSLIPCSYAVVFSGGAFFDPAPLGWDAITVSASGYSQNTVWAYVTGNDSVGNVSLTPLATVTGRVIGPHGLPIYQANVHYCMVVATDSCTTGGAGQVLGAGQTATDGTYNGTLPGGWLPWATYAISVSASGYSTDWAWVNATPGASSTVPTLTLFPTGSNSSSLLTAHGAFGSSGSSASGVWFNGRVVDALNGAGISGAVVQAVTLDGANSYQFTDGTNTGGFYNGSAPPGLYTVNVSFPGYYPKSVFVNASQAGVVNLPTIELDTLGWVTGRVVINSFLYDPVRYQDLTDRYGLGPGIGTGVQSCKSDGAGCGISAYANLGGFFNASGSPGGALHMLRVVAAAFGGGSGSVQGGFVQNQTPYNASGNFTNVGTPSYMDLFGEVQGLLYDGSDRSGTGILDLPARWAQGSVQVNAGNRSGTATVPLTVGGGGNYGAFLPGGGKAFSTFVAASQPSVFVQNQTRPPLGLRISDVSQVPVINMTHFGYADVNIVDTATGLGVPYLPASALSVNKTTGVSLTSSGSFDLANFAGQLNMTAPPERNVVFTFGPGNDFNNTTAKAWVNASKTTLLNSTDGRTVGTLLVPSWGSVASLDVNNTTSPSLVTILDQAKQWPLPGTVVTASSTVPGLSGTGTASNWAGQFFTDAPIGPKDTVLFVHPAYNRNETTLAIHTGQHVIFRTVNMTGYGVVEGRVVSYPGGLPVQGASVTVCVPRTNNCGQSTTNFSGVYWVAAPPGPRDTITVSALGYVDNSTTVVNLCSDCFTGIGTITVTLFGSVSGIVIGTPSGSVLDNATVSLCSTVGIPAGPCAFSVNTNKYGVFDIPVPAGTYILQVNDTGYNSTYQTIAINPGEKLPLGTVFLQQYGTIVGNVYASGSLVPIFNATVWACPTWSGTPCATPVTTDANGRYAVGGPPGRLQLAFAATGFADAYIDVVVKAGSLNVERPVYLTPLGGNALYTVQGRVIAAANASQPIANAVVAAVVNGTPLYSAETQASGAFLLEVPY
ncbi:MAG TPA: carboxypeptidase regulatory-like domain-containing protein, partial [Thermoplasmata archaeon]|nr:carboxypeptidase regulatory-like domain-containing protein [Thermoplasmata archaeon]